MILGKQVRASAKVPITVATTLLAELPNKAFELIPTVFFVLETCVFSVSS